MYDESLRPEAALTGSLDLEAIVASIPANYTVKGMFCARYSALLEKEYDKLSRKLIAPTRDGRYVAFKDYPQADYTRIVAAAAAKSFPNMPLPEAVRRIARDDFRTFGASVFGKVLMTLIGDPATALRYLPDAYARVAPGPNVWAEDLDPRTIRLVFRRQRGFVEYILGQLEGIVLAFNRTPLVTVRRLELETLAFDVVHGKFASERAQL
jgi:uncharacterized protein (TIGR02265 family)